MLRKTLLFALASAFLAASVAPLAWGEGAEAPLIDLNPLPPAPADPAGGKKRGVKDTRCATGSTGTTKSGHTTTRRQPPKEPKGTAGQQRQEPKAPKGASVKTATTRKPTKMSAAQATATAKLLDWDYMEKASPEAVRSLLAAGADVNAKHISFGDRPLMIAAQMNENPEVVGALLAAGADVNVCITLANLTALKYAVVHNKNPEVARKLLAAGANANVEGSCRVVLSHALENKTNPAGMMAVLLAAGADVNARNDDGSTALMEAAKSLTQGRAKIPDVTPSADAVLSAVKVLLDRGADVHVRDKRGDTALSLAEREGNTKVAELLRAAGAEE